MYANFAKQKAEKAKQQPSNKSASQQKSIRETFVSSQPYDQKSKKWMEFTNSVVSHSVL